MENIFEIKFSFEQKTKDDVIYKFSNKQGGDFNVFSFHWQCFVWAAIIGFLRNERRPLTPPIADRPFNLNTMMNNNGEKVAQALICLAIAKAGTLDIMKNPADAITLINEYANGGFYHIMKLMENGENSFNDLEKVKQEIFSRSYDMPGVSQPTQTLKINHVESEDTDNKKNIESELNSEFIEESKSSSSKKNRRWTFREENELVGYYKKGMTIEQLAIYLNKDEEAVKEKLLQKGIAL